MVLGYDHLTVNNGLLLDLQFCEGVGTLTQDWAKPRHEPVTLQTPPVWTQRVNDLCYLDFDGAGDYLDCPAAATADLDFTAGDYSIAAWYNLVDTSLSEILVGRYGVDLDGWEVYWYIGGGGQQYMSLRHHHSSLAPTRTGCYSDSWPPGVWTFMVITRSGAYPKMYRDGQEVKVTYDVGGLSDPDTCNRDLVIGTRYTKNANWFMGGMWGMRVWGRVLTPNEVRFLFERERERFDV